MHAFRWFSQDHGSVVEILVRSGSVLVVWIPEGSGTGSLACVLNSNEVRQLGNEEVFKNWVAPLGTKGRFRLLGNSELFGFLGTSLKKIGLTEGPEVSWTRSDSHKIHFVPGEGRIRMPKGGIQSRKTRVLVVDDSETIRKILTKLINEDPEMECVGAIEHPAKVEAAIQRERPDVITLDIHMPDIDGVSLLKQLAPRYRIPTVMISALSQEDGTYVLDALESGAVDYIQKPSMADLKLLGPSIREKLKNARYAKVAIIDPLVTIKKIAATGARTLDFSNLVLIGSSTGGTEALKVILTAFPDQIPPVLIVQHIPPVFSKAFADRMNHLTPFEVKEAADGDLVQENRVLIAPGGMQMKVRMVQGQLRIVLEDSAPVNRHKPSVDVLFQSVVELKRSKLVSVILTGMGTDGAQGLLKLRNSGARTIVQNEASCVVYGMPREAVRLGAAEKVLPLEQIADEIINACSARRTGKAA